MDPHSHAMTIRTSENVLGKVRCHRSLAGLYTELMSPLQDKGQGSGFGAFGGQKSTFQLPQPYHAAMSKNGLQWI